MKKRKILAIGYDLNCTSASSLVIPSLLREKWDLSPYSPEGLQDKRFDWKSPPDIIVHFHHTAGGYKHYLLWEKIKYSWGDIPFLFCITGERQDMSGGMANFSISYLPDSQTNLHLNNFFFDGSAALSLLIQGKADEEQPWFLSARRAGMNDDFLRRLNKYRNRPKTRFCNFINRNRKNKYPGVRSRNALCRELAKYKRVDCAGRIMHNTEELIDLEAYYVKNYKRPSSIRPHYYADAEHVAKLDYMSNYKFTLVGENQSAPYYITEKIIFPLLVGSIPIYWGCPEITEYVNPKAFINCNDYSSLAEVAERVAEVDQNSELYKEYTEAPVFLPNSLFYELGWDKVKAKFQRIKEVYEEHCRSKDKERKGLAGLSEKPTYTKHEGEPSLASYLRYHRYKKKYVQ